MQKNHPSNYTYAWFIDRFKKAQIQAQELAFSIHETAFLQQPAPNKWSAAECFNHLIEFGNIYYNTINNGIEEAAENLASPQQVFKPRLTYRWIIRFFEPPYKIKLKTISSFEPPLQQDFSRDEIINAFSSLQEQFAKQLQESREKGIDLNSQKVENPAIPFIKMRLSECYALAEAHQRRHLWQAEQTIAKLKH